MMYVYGYNSYGGMHGGMNVLAPIVCLVLFIDLVLAGIWLWQHIDKE